MDLEIKGIEPDLDWTLNMLRMWFHYVPETCRPIFFILGQFTAEKGREATIYNYMT